MAVESKRHGLGHMWRWLFAVLWLVAGMQVHAYDALISAVQDQSCMGTRNGSNLGCTANEFNVNAVFSASPGTPPFCMAGQSFEFLVDISMTGGNTSRYDVGFFVGQTGNDPQQNNAANQCSVAAFPNTPAPWVDTDSDSCGDNTSAGTTAVEINKIKVVCAADTATGALRIPYAVSYRANANLACSVANVAPSSQSKCQAGFATVSGVNSVLPGAWVDITKATNPSGNTEDFTFTASAAGTTVSALTGATLTDTGSTGGTYTSPGTSSTFTLKSGQTARVFVQLGTSGDKVLTITESALTGWDPVATSLTCTNVTGAGTPTTSIDLNARSVATTLNTTNYAKKCTITNTKRPRVTITKVSNGDVGTFNFTGTNSWTSQNITTTTSGVGVAGTGQYLPQNTATTITETAVAGYRVTGISCTGLGTGGTATYDTTNRSVALNAAAMAPGSDIACTFTNQRERTLTVLKALSPVADAGTFVMNANGTTGTAGGNGATASATVDVGATVNFSEAVSGGTLAANYNTAWSCNTTPAATTGSGTSGSITMPNANITCTITNTRKSATLTLRKTWVTGISGNTATVTTTGFTNNASSGLSTSTGNNTTTGTSVTVYAGEVGSISEAFGTGSASNYTASYACTGTSGLSGTTLTVGTGDTAIVCTATNTRNSATFTLRKTWSTGIAGNTATVTTTGFTNNASSGASVSTGNNTTTGTAVTVYAGEVGTIGETFSVGSASSYTASYACTGTSGLSGNQVTVGGSDTAIVCTLTNTRVGATFTLRKTWSNGISGNTATVTTTGFINNASSGASVSSGNNTTTGTSVTVYAGEVGTIGESFSIGSAANYTASYACTGTSGLVGNVLTVGAGDTVIVCTLTNTRKSATFRLQKSWSNGISGNTATVTTTGFTNNATSGLSTSTGNNSTLGANVTVYAGEVGTISETFGVGNAANYTASYACAGTSGLSGNQITVGGSDTAITCTLTNTRNSATFRLQKTWSNGISGNTATVTTTGFTNNATSGLSTSTGNNSTLGANVTVYAGEVGTIGETFGVGSAANYTVSYACAGTSGLSGNTITVGGADTAITCTLTNTRNSATFVLRKTWSNGISGNTATVTTTGFTNNASSGASVSTGNNTTTGASVTVYAGEVGAIGETFSVGSAGNYTASYACTGSSGLSGSTITIGGSDTAIICTLTNTRNSASFVLRKTWSNGINGNTATVTTTGFTNNASSGLSTSTGNNTTTGTSVTVYAGEVGTIGETFGVGSAANYTAGYACTGSSGLSGNQITVGGADTAITCTLTNTRNSATLVLRKTWSNGISGNTATVTTTGFTNNASSGLSTSTGNNTTTGSSVTVYAAEVGTISEAFGVGSAANYTASYACSGTSGLSGSTLTVGGADTAITCTLTNTRNSATFRLQKTWSNGIGGNTATVTTTGFTNNATSGLSTSTGNNSTLGANVTVYAGEVGTIAETFGAGSATNYTASYSCAGTSGLSGNTITVGGADTAITCTLTNTRNSATFRLQKTWSNGISGNTATVTTTGFTNNATSGLSTSTGNNSTLGANVTVYAGEVGTIAETFGVGSAANYTAGYSCSGTSGLSGNQVTVGGSDTAITCTLTNTRNSATFRLQKTWSNGISGNTATVTTTGFTNNATSGLSTSTGNNSTLGANVTVYAGEVGTIAETFGVGSAANYTASYACAGTSGLSGNQVTVGGADTAITCTLTNTRNSATLVLRKTWVTGISGDTATVTTTGFTNNAGSGASVSSGNNTTTGSSVTVYAAETGTIGEAFSVGNAANYTPTYACTGTSGLSGNALTVGGADTAIVCTLTNTRKSASLTLRKTWVTGINGNTATVTTTGFTNNASSGLSTSTGNNTTTGSSVTVYAAETGTISETFGTGSAANYTASYACTGTSGLSGNALTVGNADTAIICTLTNTRNSATLTLSKAWVNGASGDTATVTTAGFTNNASSGASVSTGNNTTTGSSVIVYAAEAGTFGETFSVGSAASYTGTVACSGSSGLSGGTLTVGGADTAITCTYTNTRKQPILSLLKLSSVISDPVNGNSNPKSIPGAIKSYTLRLTNTGPGAVDADTLVLSDPLPATVELYVNDLGGVGSGPVVFTDGATASGLTWTFTSLASATDDVEFSNDNGATWTYTPVPDFNGFDSAVTHIRFRPKGSMNAAGVGNPSFDLVFRVRVE